MSWLERVSAAPPEITTAPISTSQTTLGHPEAYDAPLREKASVHNPPTPPEYMGFEGEYDTTGLAKRIAKRLDEDAQLEDVPTLQIIQREAVVCFEGVAPDQTVLNRILDVATHVDGIQGVDISRVSINSSH